MRLLPLIVISALCAPGLAAAQCTKDTDCKGARVCEVGRCVAPSLPNAGLTQLQSFRSLRTEDEVRGSERRRMAGWITGGFAAAAGVTSAAMTFADLDDEWTAMYVPLGLSLSLGLTAGLSAGVGGAMARDALRDLGQSTGSVAMPVAGWILWGLGTLTAFGAGAAVAGRGDETADHDRGDSPFFGLMLAGAATSTVLTTVGLTLLQIDLSRHLGRYRKLSVSPVVTQRSAGAAVGMQF